MSEQHLPPSTVIPRALATITAVWDDTLDPPRAPGGGGSTGKPESKSPLPDGAFETRRHASAVLAAWCVYVGAERGVCPVRIGDDVERDMAAWLGGHVDWLAEQELGPVCALELDECARELDRIAHPDRVDALFIGRCPNEYVPGGPQCGRRLYWPTAALTMECPDCGIRDDVPGWLKRMGDDIVSDLVPAPLVITFVASRFGQLITQTQLWQWASRAEGTRGRRPTGVHRHGKDPQGRTLYSLNEIKAWCMDLWKVAA